MRASSLKVLAALITYFFLTAFSSQSVSGQCSNTTQNPIRFSFRANATVNVYIEPTFASAQANEIRNQLSLWSFVGLANIGINEVFHPSGLGNPYIYGANPTMQFVRTTPDFNAKGSNDITTTDFDSGCAATSYIKINPGVTNSTAFSYVVSHEIGHSFALGHCTGCGANTSAMTTGGGLNDLVGHSGPTSCDVGRMRACVQPTPTPSPTPAPGECQGPEDWGQFPQTGCMFGYTSNGIACGRSSYFMNYCNSQGGGYDAQTCSCPDPAACMAPAQGCYLDYFWLDQTCECASYSPIVIDVLGNGFDLTNAANGVDFDVAPDGVTERVSWTAANSDDAWLVLDRNGNGAIEYGSELFGNFTPQPQSEEKNGFIALAEYDKVDRGGNNDGSITASDAIFTSLRLWQDINHNGVSEQSELHTLASKGVAEIELNYRESRRVDEHGNKFKYRAKVRNEQGGDNGRWAWDVYLVPQNNNILAAHASVLSEDVAFFRPRKSRCRS